jgi:hypothetical protein
MLHMCVYIHSRFVENHPIQILEDGPLISKVVLSHAPNGTGVATDRQGAVGDRQGASATVRVPLPTV